MTEYENSKSDDQLEELLMLTVLFCKLNDAPVVTLNDAITV